MKLLLQIYSDVEVRKIILPGVGAYGDAMRNLRDTGLLRCFKRAGNFKSAVLAPLTQLICSNSDEFGHEGLG